MRGINQALNLAQIRVPEMCFPKKITRKVMAPKKVEREISSHKVSNSRQKVHIFDIWSEVDFSDLEIFTLFRNEIILELFRFF